MWMESFLKFVMNAETYIQQNCIVIITFAFEMKMFYALQWNVNGNVFVYSKKLLLIFKIL